MTFARLSVLLNHLRRFSYSFVTAPAAALFDNSRTVNTVTYPPVIKNIGAVFVCYSPKIVAHELENFTKGEYGKNYHYIGSVYARLGL